MLDRVVIPSLSFFEYIVKPSFNDLVPELPYSGMLFEFSVMDNVATRRPIIDITKKRNILQRRDASCELIYKKIMGTSTRYISTEELYAATTMCKNEFYQGAMQDWRNNDPLFANKILPFFHSAVKSDIASNSYFGNVTRTTQSTDTWSTDKYDGVFKWVKEYYAKGVIPANQGLTMPIVDMRTNPAQAFAIINSLYNNQSPLMQSVPDSEKAFYVSKPIADGYKTYVRSLGTGNITVAEKYAKGMDITSFNDIPIYPILIWEDALNQICGNNGGSTTLNNAAVLTVAGNWVYGTDKAYGEESGDGSGLNEALVVWYERKDLSWYYQNFLKAGTQIAIPEFVVFALPAAYN